MINKQKFLFFDVSHYCEYNSKKFNVNTQFSLNFLRKKKSVYSENKKAILFNLQILKNKISSEERDDHIIKIKYI